MNDIIIDSWARLQDELFKGSWNEAINRYRSPFVFRGLSDRSYRLETSLMRLGGPYGPLERHLLRNFRKYAQSDAGEFGSFWHLLAVAQHHGLPTRLLDWTYSPYVALHFATSSLERIGVDGVIWVVDFEKAHDQLPSPLRSLLRSEGAQAFTVELLTEIRPHEKMVTSEEKAFHDFVETLTEFDALGIDEEFLLFFEPPSIDDRIVNQFALFSVMPNSQRSVDEWLNENPHLLLLLFRQASEKGSHSSQSFSLFRAELLKTLESLTNGILLLRGEILPSLKGFPDSCIVKKAKRSLTQGLAFGKCVSRRTAAVNGGGRSEEHARNRTGEDQPERTSRSGGGDVGRHAILRHSGGVSGACTVLRKPFFSQKETLSFGAPA